MRVRIYKLNDRTVLPVHMFVNFDIHMTVHRVNTLQRAADADLRF